MVTFYRKPLIIALLILIVIILYIVKAVFIISIKWLLYSLRFCGTTIIGIICTLLFCFCSLRYILPSARINPIINYRLGTVLLSI